MLNLTVTTQGDASLVVQRFGDALQDRRELNAEVAERAVQLTRAHLLAIAPTHHKTAERLGATPTGYLTAIAELLQPASTDTKAEVMFPTTGLEIFARVNGPVEVRPKNVKYLTIPAAAESYGRRARSFPDLKFIPFANGTRALVRQTVEIVAGKRPGTTKKQVTNTPFYWLVTSAILPQDAGLLPTPAQYAEVTRIAIGNEIERIVQQTIAASVSESTGPRRYKFALYDN